MVDLGEALRLLHAAESRPDDVRLPAASDLDVAEAALALPIPPDYRRFLLEASAERVGLEEPGLVGPDRPPHRDLVRIARGAWEGWGVPHELFPFCTAEGNYYCLAPDGRIVFWDHDGRSDDSWPDLATWITRVWIGEG